MNLEDCDAPNPAEMNLDDKEEMLKCMLDIACDDELRSRMSQCAIADSKRFSPESVYPQWDALFEELAH